MHHFIKKLQPTLRCVHAFNVGWVNLFTYVYKLTPVVHQYGRESKTPCASLAAYSCWLGIE